MGDLFVVPLCLGHIIRDKSLFTLHSGIGEKVTFPIVAWYIGGAEAAILVDTGPSPPNETAPVHLPYSQKADETLHANLKKLGLETDDIEIVINTLSGLLCQSTNCSSIASNRAEHISAKLSCTKTDTS